MSESLRNDGRIWVPTKAGEARRAADIPETDRDYYLERMYPAFGNLVPRDVASRNAKQVVDGGAASGPSRNGVYLDFADGDRRPGARPMEEKYGNLFEMYERITGENPYRGADAHLPGAALHDGRPVGRLRPAEHLPGLFVLGEANFRDHGANRLGASALMQGLADGYFVAAVHDRSLPLRPARRRAPAPRAPRSTRRSATCASASTACSRSRALARSTSCTASSARWCGTSAACRAAARVSKSAIEHVRELREEFWETSRSSATGEELNQSLEKAGRVADFLELAELMCLDALDREESCGGHFREEYQTSDGEAMRDDEQWSYVARGVTTGGRSLESCASLLFENVTWRRGATSEA